MLVTRSEFMRGLIAAGEAAGTENRSCGCEGHFQPGEQLSHRWLVGCEEPGWFSGKLQMQVADCPTDAGRSRGCDIECNLDHGLGCLLDDIPCGGGLKNNVAVSERRG
jgi:hypothetical protein